MVPMPVSLTSTYFNPRHRAGSDMTSIPKDYLMLRFQSTPPHRQRFAPVNFPAACMYFNPRPRTGSDSKNTQTSSLHLVYNITLSSYLQLISTDSSHSPPPLLPIFSPTTSANLPINPCSLSIRTGNSLYTYT